MPNVSLKKILSKKEIRQGVEDLIETLQTQVKFKDIDDTILLGDRAELKQKNFDQYPISVEGTPIGFVEGDKNAKTVAKLVSLLASQELDKKTLAQELLAKYREMTLLYNISEKIIASCYPEEVAQLVFEEARKFITATNGSMMLLDETTEKLESIAAFSSDPNCSFQDRIVDAWNYDELVYNVTRSGRGEIVNDLGSDPRLLHSRSLVNSTICVPLKTNNKAIGALALGSKTSVTYTTEDLKLLTTLASQAASAINALHHENKLKESRREALLFRLASQIRLSLDPDRILTIALKEIRQLLQVDRCFFMWYQTPAVPSNTTSIDDSYKTGWQVVNETKKSDLPSIMDRFYSEKLIGWTEQLLLEKILRLDDTNNLEDAEMQQFFTGLGVRSLLAVPIETRSGQIGMMSCSSCDDLHPWSDSDVELLQAVSIQLAIALDQAELYQQSRIATNLAEAKARELEQALENLKQAQVQLIQSEKMSSLGQMVAGIAHEINNPVNFIHGNLAHLERYAYNLLSTIELYQQSCPTPPLEIQEAIEEIDLEFMIQDLPKMVNSMQLGTERIREIIVTLRNFSRVDQAKMKPADLHSGIDSTLLILRDRLKPKPGHPNIEVIKDYGELPNVQCYAGQLNQVFMNLLANAIDALEEASQTNMMGDRSPTICIRTEVQQGLVCQPGSSNGHSDPSHGQSIGDRAIVRISDNGPGIPKAMQGRLFDPFFTTKPVGKGTGLGLSISYQIVVEKHGGQLSCISAPDSSTEFVISLPIAPIERSRQKKSAKHSRESLNACMGSV